MASGKSKVTIIKQKDDLPQRIREFRLQKGLMQGQLGRLIGASANSIANWEAGIGHPTATKIKALCIALDITPDQLFGFPTQRSMNSKDEDQLLDAYRRLSPEDKVMALAMLEAFVDTRSSQQAERVRDWFLANYIRVNKNALKVSAGTGEPLWDHRGQGYEYLKRNSLTEQADEVITVHGDSMEPKYHDGDDLLVEHADSIDYGDVGIFVFDGEGLVKEYRREGLYSINSAKYKLIPAKRLEGCKCVGRVLGIITPDMRAGQEDKETLQKLYASKNRKD